MRRAIAISLLVWAFVFTVQLASASCSTPSNAIERENCLAGTPSTQWDVSGAGDSTIQGYATDISVNKGETVHFKVKTVATAYRLDIYRMGYYAGNGARLVATVTPSVSLPQSQPACLSDSSVNLVDCGNWAESAVWTVPADAVSGIYFAKLVRTDGTTGSSHIVFIVRDDASNSALLFQASDTTWQAYNNYGGSQMDSSPTVLAKKVSYNRPFTTRGVETFGWVFNAEYPMVRWLEANGYDVTYSTDTDSDRHGNLIQNHKVFLSVGHDEYWSGAQRANVEAARATGVNLAFFSANELYRKTRWELSIDGRGTPHRTLVCYNESYGTAPSDPADPPTWTGLWRDPRFSPPADGGKPENALSGSIFMVNGPRSDSIQIPAADGKMRFWRNTAAAALSAGQTYTTPAGTLGFEWNEDLDNGFRPDGVIRLSTATYDVQGKFLDYIVYGPGTATHHATLYKAPSGAIVFGSGTVQWAWGLDSNHDTPGTPTDRVMQQATVNLLADMGAQPVTLQPGLIAATASTDTVAPTSVITAPAAGTSVNAGGTITVAGTAADVGGGVVGGVEVSIEGGATWHPATGRGSWSYTGTVGIASTTATIMSRAVDDSLNLEKPTASVTVSVLGAIPGATTIWPATTIPAMSSSGDINALEVGVRFRSDVDGFVRAIRFYKGTANTGTHIGNLWTNTGTNLASATFVNETASGWQQVDFAQPVAITANTTYVASYHTDVGQYAVNLGYFAKGYDNPPLHALQDGVSGGNGAYKYSATTAFPDGTYGSANYWVDVLFSPSGTTGPPMVMAQTPLSGSTSVSVSTNVTATFNRAMNASTITASTFRLLDSNNQTVAATVSYNATTQTANLTPSAVLANSATYTAVVTGGSAGIKDTAGGTMAGDVSWSFTTAAVVIPTVVSTTPANSATVVNTTTSVAATFNEAMSAGTITTGTFQLSDSSNNNVAASVSYNAATLTATLQPSSALAYSSVYKAVVRGGSTGVQDPSGHVMAADYSWTFTTAAALPPPGSCPCTIWPATATPAVAAADDNGAVELGVRFRSDQDGFISGIRFYKGSGNTGTHIGNLWTNSGTNLATAVFVNETATGWQQVTFSSPIAIKANTTYVASYHTTVGHYSYNSPFFTTGIDNTPLHALATGVDGSNGLYIYGPSAFPSQSYNTSNYWVDVVFSPTSGVIQPPSVIATAPANNATGTGISAPVTVTFSTGMDATTINSTTLQLRDGTGAVVAASVNYDSSSLVATLQPSTPLAYSSTYSASVVGGASGVKDRSGNTMSASYTWSFTTAAAPPPPPSQGPGGPILVVTSGANPITTYFAEILRSEGFNEFATADVSQVTADLLSKYSATILGQMSLTSAQVTLFTDWVNAGGNLIAMRPDKQLAALLGLTDAGGTLSDAYLAVNTGSAPGSGIVAATIQYHGTADLYSLNGATQVARLYNTTTTASSSPAVTMRTVGTGSAAAFTYDLALSVVRTRQGNPLWAGQERDGVTVIRSDDMFFPDYVDLSKVSIPQADEQQRLLANMILTMNQQPLPRFWYLPNMKKAVIVMTGDDHAYPDQSGTAGRFDGYLQQSASGCSVSNWECIRATSYLQVGHPMTDAQAAYYNNLGFEIAAHVTEECSDFTPDFLEQSFTRDLTNWQAQYPSQPAPVTNRTHCVPWSDWSTHAQVELALGIRLDTNYYYYPGTWVNDRPGFFTGSGMPMRFVDAQGNTLDIYQAATQMPDESNQTYPFTVDTLINNALGSQGYYGVFTTNFHTDNANSSESAATVASAKAAGVSIVSARQMLTWIDGRNNSSFGSFTWNGSLLTFNISVASGANGIQAMLPVNSAAGALTTLTRDGANVSFSKQTIKGIQYAIFAAVPGLYAASYGGTSPVALAGVTLNPTNVVGGTPSIGTVTLTGAATGSGITVALSSSNTDAATVPTTVTVPAGSSTANFTITTLAVTSSASVTISASYSGSTVAANIAVNAPLAVSSVTLSPTSVTGGQTSTGTVTLSAAAPSSGATVALSSNNASAATVPATVTVPANSTTATFTVTSLPVAATTTVSISAAYGSANKLANLTVNPATLSGLSLSPTVVIGGASSTGTVTLTGPAPSGGTIVTLTSANTAVATVPATVTVAANATSATFAITTFAVGASTPVSISSSLGGASASATLTVNPQALTSLTLSPTTVAGGASSTGTVILGGAAPSGGTVVTLQSNNSAATVPSSVTVAAGSTTGTFTITTSPVTAQARTTITASYGGVNRTATLTVNPPAVTTLSLSPTSVIGGSSSTGTVRLSGAAPAGGVVVTLTDNSTAASVPASVTVSAGATTATFTITTAPVASRTSVSVSATYGGTKSAMLTITAPTLSSVSLNPTSVTGGASSTGTVALTGSAPSGGSLVTLSSNRTAAATTPASATVPAGARTATFTVTTYRVTSTTSVTISGSYGANRSASLTVRP